MKNHSNKSKMDFFFKNIKIDQNIILLTITIWLKSANIYRKVTSSNRACLEVHAGFFRLLMKGIFDPYVL